jgi:hypothetical protein
MVEFKKQSTCYEGILTVKNGCLVVAELKSESGETSPEQDRWLIEFARVAGCLATVHLANVKVFVWRPSDWESIVSVAKGEG